MGALTSRKNTAAEDFLTKLRQIGLGGDPASSPDPAAGASKPAVPEFYGPVPEGMPYPHAGILAGLLGANARQFYTEIVVDPDDSALVGDSFDTGVKIAAADNIELDLGFRPNIVIWGQQNGALTTEIFIKFRGLDFAAIKDKALRMLLVADLTDGTNNRIEFVDSRIRLNNVAEDNTNYVTIFSGATADNTRHFLLAMG